MTRDGRGPRKVGKRQDGRQARPAAADPARRAAYDVLHEVGSSDAYANLTMRLVFADRRLTTRDAGFATELVMGVLRHRGTLDAVLAAAVDRPLAKLDPRVLDVLRLGAYQLLFLGTAPHAAVGSSVDLAGEVCGPGPKGLVNAVLRTVARRDLADHLAQVTMDLTPAEAMAVRTSHPTWIVSSLRDALGGDDEALAALLARNNDVPTVTLAARPGRINRDDLLALAPDGAESGAWSPYAVRLRHGRPGDLAPVRDHRAGVQDEGSQLMALLLADAPLTGVDRTWLDLCAGPGGKAALLASLAHERDAAVLAVEPRAARARLVAQALAGARATAVVQADGRAGPWQPDTFDRVLVDAPCTGLGVLRRRPEARWRRTPADVAALTTLQRALLHAAADAVRPGGLVAYVTCSPHIAETDLVVDDVLASRSDLVEVDARAGLPTAATAAAGGGPRVRLWPHLHDTDGMFAALLRKR